MSSFKVNNIIFKVIGTLTLCTSSFAVAVSANAQQAQATPPAGVAATPVAPVISGTAFEIQKINENMTILQAQLSQLDLQVQLATKRRDLSGLNGETTGFSSFSAKKGNPAIVSVAGLKGHLEAVLVFPGGATQRVKVGDVIDERKVTTVSRNEVVLTHLKGKNTQRLSFNTSATMNDVPVANDGMILPPMSGRPQLPMPR